MEPSVELLKILANAGVGVIIFVIWWVSTKNQNKQFYKMLDQNRETLERFFGFMKEDNKYKELLSGILTRLETKIDFQNKQKN